MASEADDVRYSRDWGWEVGVYHTVIFMDLNKDGKMKVADPALGIEYWGLEGLEVLWDGNMMYLKKNEF